MKILMKICTPQLQFMSTQITNYCEKIPFVNHVLKQASFNLFCSVSYCLRRERCMTSVCLSKYFKLLTVPLKGLCKKMLARRIMFTVAFNLCDFISFV